MNNDMIEFSCGGYFGGYNTIHYSNGKVALSNSQKPFDKQTEDILEENLKAFWQQIDSIGVWDWQDEYVNPTILDGTQWKLKLVHGDREKTISGSNMFPPNISISDNRESEDFHQLIQAVNELIGRNYFEY